MRRKPRGSAFALGALLTIAATVVAGETDWFTRVREMGLGPACELEVTRHEKGVLGDSLHVGECYYHLEKWEEGVAVFGRLLRSPDRNYAAAALAKVGEGQYHLGKADEARATFVRCVEEHPEAWLDGAVAERCRAWLAKLAGNLVRPGLGIEEEDASLVRLAKDVAELDERVAELNALLRRLTEK